MKKTHKTFRFETQTHIMAAEDEHGDGGGEHDELRRGSLR
jgi:hypothetical protein